MNSSRVGASVRALIIGLFANSAGAVSIDLVTVGNPGNAPDTRYPAVSRGISGFGSVGYAYQIGKFEVTAGQYCEFLNAVATVGDPHRLYSGYMTGSFAGCKIQRTGAGTLADPYMYSIASDRANRPVNCTQWGAAARFCNWLTNGQPVGGQDSTTTEDGSYTLVGTTSEADMLSVTRNPNARFVIPTEDEWYKAAYYDPNKPGGAGYWTYPTRSDVVPGNQLLHPDPGNNVNGVAGNYTIGSPYYLTEVGAFANSFGPYGTFDQGGNVWEWNEGIIAPYSHCMRGSSFAGDVNWTKPSMTTYGSLTWDDPGTGFRVGYVPEPTTLILLAVGGLAVIRRRG
jgi:formylglycine-generating enzyme